LIYIIAFNLEFLNFSQNLKKARTTWIIFSLLSNLNYFKKNCKYFWK